MIAFARQARRKGLAGAAWLAAGLLAVQPAARSAGADETAAGARALYANCAGCHGDYGQGNAAVGAPNIAGLDAVYIERQLRNFASGVRGDAGDGYGARMRAALQALPDPGGQRAVAAYVAALPRAAPVPAAGAPQGNRDAGRNYYNAICSACHNGNGRGSPALSAPRLVGTDPRYLLRQLAAFRRGARGAHPDDRYGAQMRKMVLSLPGPGTEQDIVAYVATLDGAAP